MSTLKVNNVTDLGDDAVITDGALVGAGKILQVVSTVKTNVFTTAARVFTDVTDLAVTITPSSATSKIFVSAYLSVGASGDAMLNARFLRDSTPVFIGDAAGSRPRGFFGHNALGANRADFLGPSFLDTPETTSATTYKIQVFANAVTLFVGRTGADRDGLEGRHAASITVMEVAG